MKYDDYLVHYGVLGMKWGVRKSRKKSSGSGSAEAIRSRVKKLQKSRKAKVVKKKREKAASKKSREANKPARKMTDAELSKAIKRLEMEQRYKTLKKSQMSVGKKLVFDILRDSGKQVGTQVATYAMGKAVNKAVGANVVNVGTTTKKKKVKVTS
ncbi:DUF7211 domain-containing protein [Turicimonas muris]|uniref:DUF7211 domain-containing protein n=1 Tax=Turicimonas muris TaxID=1796652 RepID=UPI00261AE5E5|nr:hypothetical protein [Turicimonas muris]